MSTLYKLSPHFYDFDEDEFYVLDHTQEDMEHEKAPQEDRNDLDEFDYEDNFDS